MSHLFSPLKIKGIEFKNRIVVSPMCQYVGIDGMITDWHRNHYTKLAHGGAGLVIIEATAVSPEGRISPGDLGIWNDGQAAELAKLAATMKQAGTVPGIQLAHAGRKASANRPWEGDDHMAATDPRSWEIIAPSAIALGAPLMTKVPREMTLEDIKRVQADYVAAAERVRDAGFEFLEMHFAHGYLANSFLSKHSNTRTDQYGGNLENRSRFILETVAAITKVWPQDLPFAVRLGVIEFDGQDEETVADAILVAKELVKLGIDLLDVSMGFTTLQVKIPWGTPAFLKPVAAKFRQELDILISSTWGFDTPEIANNAVTDGSLDLVMIGKAHLANPQWAYHAARKLGIDRPSWVLPAPYAHWLERYAVGE
jgi:2,4-dienoyl-CoA reductase-like NADH-dependent reductase (Old Yellow Enzyme family)